MTKHEPGARVRPAALGVNSHAVVLDCFEACRPRCSAHFDVKILSRSSSFGWYSIHKLELVGVDCLVTCYPFLTGKICLVLTIFGTWYASPKPINDKSQGTTVRKSSPGEVGAQMWVCVWHESR